MTSPNIEGRVLPAIPSSRQRRIPTETGIASLTYNGQVFRFRTNPNKIRWTYTPNHRTDLTIGGRVIQLLSAKIDDLVIVVEAGNGRWEYYQQVVEFAKNLLVEQKSGRPATFEYTTRGWKLNCFITSIPFADEITAVTRPIELNFKVQEDVSGVMSQNSLSKELKELKDGVGWKKSKYNQPDPNAGKDGESGWWGVGDLISNITEPLGDLAEAITGTDPFQNIPSSIPGNNPILAPFQ